MDVVVVGAGALGAYFGGRFEETGANVTFLVREKRAEQLRENGIKISSNLGEYKNESPNYVTDARKVDHADLVVVSVKGYHLPGTLDSLKVLAEKGAYVLPVLNGIEHISYLQDQLGEDVVLGGLSFIIATLNEKGHVIHSGDFHDLIFGPLTKTQTNICQRIEKLCDKANMNGIYSDSILLELWKKYTFINAFSGITTAANLSIGQIREHDSTFKIAETILQEMKNLAKEYHVDITGEDIESAKSKLLGLDKEATSSMHQDRRKGLTLEVDHLHGGALRLAKAVGLDLPYIETVYGLIKPFENA
ncbi:ketopantoate reductase family protein [Virgibacillus oceani]|uniref:2-dehydropantoate 2-reductase n=1 Tax=Virgibacillus oceani TaxID=1479511 RepID=A0A917HKI6_9BACI|nr:2-dehydropantoate 2-reductase [Virgibacillus oceani]GGG81610.1 2-dehydropantoate 2-reductase [Virgibacillus oceani]